MGTPNSYTKTFAQCTTSEERVALVRQAMKDGHSNKSAAEALRTTPGTIAGIRFRYEIPSAYVKKPPAQLAQSAIAPQRLKVAASEATQCTEMLNGGDPHRCGYERVPGLDKCPLHCGRRVKRAS